MKEKAIVGVIVIGMLITFIALASEHPVSHAMKESEALQIEAINKNISAVASNNKQSEYLNIYKMYELQSMNIDTFPNIVGWRETEGDLRGYTNVLISDNQQPWLKKSERCTKAKGEAYSKAIFNSHEFVNKSVTADELSDYMAYINTWIPMAGYETICKDKGALESINKEVQGVTGKSSEYFNETNQKVIDIGNIVIATFSDGNGFSINFEFQVDKNKEVQYWYMIGKAYHGGASNEYFTAYYNDYGIGIRLADKNDGKLVLYKYVKEED